MRIYGIGTDIVEVERIAAVYARHGERFAKHVLHAEEMPELTQTHHPARFLAKRFAAKEAFAKAMGTGLRYPVTLPNIRITHDALGKPGLTVVPAVQAVMTQRAVVASHLSISDEKELVVAFVVLEQDA